MNQAVSPSSKSLTHVKKTTAKTHKIRRRKPGDYRKSLGQPRVVFRTLEDQIAETVNKFFQIASNYDTMYNYIKTKKINLLYWGITNYAKMHDIRYHLTQESDRIEFVVFDSYQTYRDQVGKTLFDCYARGAKMEASSGEPGSDDYKVIQTTLGQLNMFRWAIENNVIAFVLSHYSEIEKDYQVRYKQRVRSKGKKQELSITSSVRIVSEHSDVTDVVNSWLEHSSTAVET